VNRWKKWKNERNVVADDARDTNGINASENVVSGTIITANAMISTSMMTNIEERGRSVTCIQSRIHPLMTILP
jgi:hypothetical protein